jgi:bacterioferritin (cytochrome b1)
LAGFAPCTSNRTSNQLGVAPDFSPDRLNTRSHAEYVEGDTLASMIREDLVAERIAIDSYREFIKYLDTTDSSKRRLLESILAVEEEHADELADLLDAFPIKSSQEPRAARALSAEERVMSGCCPV